MKKKISFIFALGLFFLGLIFSSISFAEEIETAGDYFASIGTKFGRGLENVVTSPAEIPCTMAKDMGQGDNVAHFFTGFGKGTAFFLRRVLVGVTEVGTFFIPMERTIPTVCSDKPLETAGS